jgi:hypothetical protein
VIGVPQSPLSKSQKRMVAAVLRSESPKSPVIRKRKVPLNDTDSYSSPVMKSKKKSPSSCRKKIKDTTTSSRKRKSSKEITSSSKKRKEVPEIRRTHAAKRVSRKKVDNDMLVDIFGSSASGVIKK